MPAPVSPRHYLTVPITAALALLVGCAAQPGTGPAAARTDFPLISKTDQVIRPIDHYWLTADETIRIEKVKSAVETQCLHSHQYMVSAVASPNLAAFDRGAVRDRVVRSDLYGFFDTETVTQYGYVRPPAIPGEVAVELPKGVPESIAHECSAAGVKAIIATDSSSFPDGGPPSAANDLRVQAATKKWVVCMTDAGHPTPNPIQSEGDHQTTTPADVAVAVADIRCKIQTNLVGIATGVQAEYDSAYITKYRQRLDSLRAIADAILGSSR